MSLQIMPQPRWFQFDLLDRVSTIYADYVCAALVICCFNQRPAAITIFEGQFESLTLCKYRYFISTRPEYRCPHTLLVSVAPLIYPES
jgi:hypothetical protein